MADKKPNPAKPVMDVSRPGKSAPSPNSKSVIVNNRPMLKDPMVVKDKADNSLAKVSSRAKERLLTAPLLETEEPDATGQATEQETAKPNAKPTEVPTKAEELAKNPSHAKSAKVIAPIEAEPKAKEKPAKPPKLIEAVSEDETPEPTAPAPAEPAAEPTPPAEPKQEPEAKPAEASKPSQEETKPAQDSQPAATMTDGGTESSTAPKDKKAAEAEIQEDKEAKHQALIEKLADSKKYYLPINMVEKRRSKHVAIAGIILSLLLIVAWADIALDAGLIHVNGIKPVTHFFSN